MSFEPTLFWVVILFTVTAAIIDFAERRVPNWLTVTTSLSGFTYYWLAAGWPGLAFSLQGFATGFGLLFALWLIGGGGGGDVKLMAATGSLFGPKLTLVIFFASALLALLGVTVLAVAGLLNKGMKSFEEGEKRKSARVIPYALPAAGAAWLVLAWQVTVR